MTADGAEVTFYGYSPDLDINQTLKGYLQKLSFSWGSRLSLWMLCPFLLPSLSVSIGKDYEFYTLRCSSVECQPQKFILKISLLPHLSSLFCLWVTSGVLAEVSRQLCTAPDSPRAAGWSDQRGRLSCFVFAECRFKSPLGSGDFQNSFLFATDLHTVLMLEEWKQTSKKPTVFFSSWNVLSFPISSILTKWKKLSPWKQWCFFLMTCSVVYWGVNTFSPHLLRRSAKLPLLTAKMIFLSNEAILGCFLCE